MDNYAKRSLEKLYSYCTFHNWIGHDPFDGLNSKLFQSIPFLRNRKIFRLAFLQFNKKSPINFRHFLRVERGRNPKGIGLFLSAFLNLYRQSPKKEYLDLIKKFVEWLKADVAKSYKRSCWGYNFDWQSRAFFLPKGTPTVVNTSIIGRVFVKAYEIIGSEEYLDIACAACNFILSDLNRLEENDSICFSYSPLDHYFVNNATALASSLLSTVYEITGERELSKIAKRSIQYVVDHQQENGGWYYGESKTAQGVGIDNFHTGFILESLKIYSDKTRDNDYIKNIRKGLSFYQEKFFLADGAPKYYFRRSHPFDIHSACQAIVTLVQLKNYGADLDLCSRIVRWMIDKMQDEKGYFYYQKGWLISNRIPYMRWAQAWAFHALSTYIDSNG